MKKRMEISQHWWKFIYKHSDIKYICCMSPVLFFYDFFLPAQEWEIFL